jgi:hypothetical protein
MDEEDLIKNTYYMDEEDLVEQSNSSEKRIRETLKKVRKVLDGLDTGVYLTESPRLVSNEQRRVLDEIELILKESKI